MCVVAPAARCGLARRAAFALLALALPWLALAPPPDPRIDRVERWLNAVAQHEPGQADDAVAEIASWSSPEMRMLWIDVSVLVQLMRNRIDSTFESNEVGR